MKAVVTGGAGFVGSHLAQKLLDEKFEVVVVDDLSTGKESNIPQGVEFIEDDISDIEMRDSIFESVDYIFHLAARNIVASTFDPNNDFETNVGGTFRLLQMARENKNLKRFVYTSSASVYGNSKHLPVCEDDGFDILSPYSASKLCGEHYCVAFGQSYNIPYSIIRYSNVYGSRQGKEGVVGKFMRGEMFIHGDGEQTRDFTYVDDAVEATYQIAMSPKGEGEAFNVGTGIETSINRLAKMVHGKVEYIDRRDIDNIRRRCVNIDKIRKLIKWTPRFTLSEGLARMK